MKNCMLGSSFVISLCVIDLINFAHFAQAQAQTQTSNATTDPSEG